MQWLATIPQTVRQLLITVKRYYQPEWGEDWREHFSVDRINGFLGNELKFENQKLVGKLSAHGLRSRRLLAHLQTAAGFQSRRQGAGGGRYHGLGGAAASKL